MTQTVSLQRGTVTYTANGSTNANNTTLFTNGSSGTATRVIVNYISIQNPYNNTGPYDVRTTSSGFLGVVNGSATAMIGAMKYYGGSADSGYMNACMPIMDPGPAMFAGATNAYILPSIVNSSVSTNEVGYQNQKTDNIYMLAGSTTVGGFCPRNFWIGPSDVVKWFPQSSYYTYPSGKSSAIAYNTQTLYYSFTLITES